jgi:hypothetical protein
MNFISADALYDIPIHKQIEIISADCKYEIIELQRIRNEYIAHHNRPWLLEPVKELKKKIRVRLTDEIAELKFNSEKINILSKPTFIVAEYFYNYFDNEGNSLPENQWGFDAVISNPPWEASKPVKKRICQS